MIPPLVATAFACSAGAAARTWENAEQVPGMQAIERQFLSVYRVAKSPFSSCGLIQCFLGLRVGRAGPAGRLPTLCQRGSPRIRRHRVARATHAARSRPGKCRTSAPGRSPPAHAPRRHWRSGESKECRRCRFRPRRAPWPPPMPAPRSHAPADAPHSGPSRIKSTTSRVFIRTRSARLRHY